MFRRNLEDDFNKYNKDGNDNLNHEEFYAFMEDRTNAVGMQMDEDMMRKVFEEMDVNQDGGIDVDEFVTALYAAFKNAEDNIEFLAKDIKEMDEKIDDVKAKLENVHESPTGETV